MGILKKVVMINSGLLEYSEIDTDGHTALIGISSSGKTTILRAIEAPLNMTSRGLGLGRDQKSFQNFYFQDENGNDLNNAYIVYEFVNDLGGPFTVILHKEMSNILAEFIRAPFNRDWFFGEDDEVDEWPRVKERIGGDYAETIRGMVNFNRRMMGLRGTKDYVAEFSYLHLRGNGEVFSALLACLMQGGRGSVYSDVVKEALILSYLKSYESVSGVVGSRDDASSGIDLSRYIQGLDSFSNQVDDFKLMDHYKPGSKDPFYLSIDDVFNLCDNLDDLGERLVEIPGRYLSAIRRESDDLGKINAELEVIKQEYPVTKENYESSIKSFKKEIRILCDRKAADATNLKTINGRMGMYSSLPEGVSFNDLAEWVSRKAEIEADLVQLKTKKDALEGPFTEIKTKRDEALEAAKERFERLCEDKNREYDKCEEAFKARYDKRIAMLRDGFEKNLDDLLSTFSDDSAAFLKERYGKVSEAGAGEAAAAVREALIGSMGDSLSDSVVVMLSQYAGERGKDDWMKNLGNLLKSSCSTVDELHSGIVEYSLAARDSGEKMNYAETLYAQICDWMKARRKAEIILLNERKKQADERIRGEYDRLVEASGGEVKLKEIQQVCERYEACKKKKDLTDKYPSAYRDKIDFFDKKDGYEKSIQVLDKEIESTVKKSDTLQADFDKFKKDYEYKERVLNERKLALETSLGKYRRMSEINHDFFVLLEGAREIFDERDSDVILASFTNTCVKISEYQESLVKAVRCLYIAQEDGSRVLSGHDTFNLGLEDARIKSDYKSHRNIADGLRRLFLNDSVSNSLSEYKRQATKLWENLISSIVRDYQSVSLMIHDIMKRRKTIMAFLNKHNGTDCFTDVSLEIVPSDDELLKVMEVISEFYNEESFSVGREDNIFSDDKANGKALSLLKRFAENLSSYVTKKGTVFSFKDSFALRIGYTDNGIRKRSVEVNSDGSTSTLILLKAFINMSLISAFFPPTENTRIYCPVDEVNNMSPSNVPVLMNFADKAGFYIVATGQSNPAKAVFDYSYRTSKRTADNGITYGFVEIAGKAFKLKEKSDVV